MKKLFVSVGGTLGVGKTTFVNFISKEFGYHKIEENFKANPFLESFYKDKKRWSFHSEMFFLVEKVKQIKSIEPDYGKKSIVLDTPIYGDVFPYGGGLLKEKAMTKAEWRVYMDAFRVYEKHLLRPDLIFYLHAPVPVIYKRVLDRGRRMEFEMGKKKLIAYLTLLQTLNNKWIKSYSKQIKIVPLDVSDMDYIHDPEQKERLKRLVEKHLV